MDTWNTAGEGAGGGLAALRAERQRFLAQLGAHRRSASRGTSPSDDGGEGEHVAQVETGASAALQPQTVPAPAAGGHPPLRRNPYPSHITSPWTPCLPYNRPPLGGAWSPSTLYHVQLNPSRILILCNLGYPMWLHTDFAGPLPVGRLKAELTVTAARPAAPSSGAALEAPQSQDIPSEAVSAAASSPAPPPASAMAMDEAAEEAVGQPVGRRLRGFVAITTASATVRPDPDRDGMKHVEADVANEAEVMTVVAAGEQEEEEVTCDDRAGAACIADIFNRPSRVPRLEASVSELLRLQDEHGAQVGCRELHMCCHVGARFASRNHTPCC